MPQQNPITRVAQVASDLGWLADEIEGYLGPYGKQALLHWRTELLEATDELQRRANFTEHVADT